MYQYNEHDKRLVFDRAHQFQGQVERRLAGEITELEFKPLRLQNGLYMQLHAYMLRIAIPYGLLSSAQMRMLAEITRKYDRGYAHWTTRQNLQLNWPKLQEMPKLLEDLASVEMHAIQTSGNCIRNITSDPYAGVAQDELEDPRPYAELMRQWSTFHPEFAALPRKFKIAITGTPSCDRAAVKLHDIGVRIVEGPGGERGYQILVGGGLGRTPVVASVIREFLPFPQLLSYLEAILRIYNQHGRRDNKYRARIKILVNDLGVEKFTELVEEEWSYLKDTSLTVTEAELDRMRASFLAPNYEKLPAADASVEAMKLSKNRGFGLWVRNNVVPHKVPGYVIANISVKHPDVPPGDMSDTQMDAVAALADKYSFSQVVVTHTQNLVLTDVKASDLEALWKELDALDLATPNAGLLTDIISCPGLDFCSLANARSIPIAQKIAARFDDVDYLNDLGPLSVKISGCINACGHHHIGNIGILGIDKGGVEAYQLLLGGSPDNDASIGKILGPALDEVEVVEAVAKVLKAYVGLRSSDDETFLENVRRVGLVPYKEAVYGAN